MSIMFHLWSADGWVTNPHVAPHVAPCCPVCLCAMWKCRANFKHDWVQLDPQGQFDASTFIRIKLRYISIHVIVKWLVHLSISISCWWSDLQHSPKKTSPPIIFASSSLSLWVRSASQKNRRAGCLQEMTLLENKLPAWETSCRTSIGCFWRQIVYILWYIEL